MRICIVLMLIVSSVLWAEEVTVDNFVDNYTRITKVVDKFQSGRDKKSQDLYQKGKERLSYYEAFLGESNRDTVEELMVKCIDHVILLQSERDKKDYIKYAQKLMKRLIERCSGEFTVSKDKLENIIKKSIEAEMCLNKETAWETEIEYSKELTNKILDLYSKDANAFFTKYNMPLETASRKIYFDRTHISLDNIFNNIKIVYSFSFGAITLSPNENSWVINKATSYDNPEKMLSLKIISDFAGKDLIELITRNLSLINSSDMKSSTKGISIGRIDGVSSVLIDYSFGLNPDKTSAANVVHTYNGVAAVSTLIEVNNKVTVSTKIVKVEMPSRDYRVACTGCGGSCYTEGTVKTKCQTCNGTGNKDPRYYTQAERYRMEAMMDQGGSGTYRIPCSDCNGTGSVGEHSEVKCSQCNGTGKSVQRKTDTECPDLNKLKTFISNNMNSQQ